MAPGTYTITVKLGDHESKATVRVLGDPRSTNTAADWQAREAAITRLGHLQDTLAAAVDRIRGTRTDIDAVLAKVKKSKEENASTETPPLVASGETLKKKLTTLERRLWTPYDTSGIPPETDALTHLYYLRGYLTGNWAPPSPTHLEYLRQSEKEISEVLADFNHLYATDVADFRRQVEAAKVGLLPEMEALDLKTP